MSREAKTTKEPVGITAVVTMTQQYNRIVSDGYNAPTTYPDEGEYSNFTVRGAPIEEVNRKIRGMLKVLEDQAPTD